MPSRVDFIDGMDMEVRKITVLLLIGILIAMTAVQAQAKTYTVSVKNMAFQPKELTISAGDTVTWTNDDPVMHDVDIAGIGKSPDLSKGGTYSRTFNEPGTYSYDCDFHPYMTGKIIVK
jgi:amicyanin